ncbi:hypothetical protein VP1G_11274 [Cytospora mali]|uniref:Putative gamma-glutamylcyclotransferase n=1 Tax=Cytospora mali TaxID=578113 RepID=A0A194VA69_CYTMA|nr:hypothetical protein VP1G_11274 [Valsa mali var. pyri (nom. inval.)]
MNKLSEPVLECNDIRGGETLDGQTTESGTSSAPASTTRSNNRPSRMLRKFLAAAEREGKELYFFYGSLMDPWVIQRVLGLFERPVLKPAGLYGWHMKIWGPYPVLTEDGPTELTRGMVYEVEGSELKARLAAYETERYREQMCEISVDGSKETVTGKTFVWAGDSLDSREGKFDLKDWQMERVLDD